MSKPWRCSFRYFYFTFLPFPFFSASPFRLLSLWSVLFRIPKIFTTNWAWSFKYSYFEHTIFISSLTRGIFRVSKLGCFLTLLLLYIQRTHNRYLSTICFCLFINFRYWSIDTIANNTFNKFSSMFMFDSYLGKDQTHKVLQVN